MANRVNVNSEELKDRLVAINRVVKVTKGGRTFTFAAIVVVGDGKGVIGYGLGKAGEVTAAIAKGVEAAKKNLVKVPVINGTVPHEQAARFGGAEVIILPASEGTGVVAGGAMRAVLESVGRVRPTPTTWLRLPSMRSPKCATHAPWPSTVVFLWKKYSEDKALWQR